MLGILNETIKAGLLCHNPQNKFIGKERATLHPPPPLLGQSLPFMQFHIRNATMICGVRRRRRADIRTDTYVLMEPGKDEEFVSEEELRERLKGWLQNWPANALPADLARFENIDDAVEYLVKCVCELEIDGEAGSLQWFEVRLQQQDNMGD
nr:protein CHLORORESPIRATORY REDUCTION 7, chloroplastic [Ipomoea batatas]